MALAIGYTMSNWRALIRFVDDGRIEAHNNIAERALRGVAIGRKNYLHLGSDTGGERAAVIYSLLGTALCRARHKAVYADRRTMPSGIAALRICLGWRSMRSA
jgi:transposase